MRIELAFGLTVTGLALLVGHWFPWPRRLHRLAAYCYGVASIGVGTAIWLGLRGEWVLLGELVLFAVVGGLATAGGYGVDWLLNQWQRSRLDERDEG